MPNSPASSTTFATVVVVSAAGVVCAGGVVGTGAVCSAGAVGAGCATSGGTGVCFVPDSPGLVVTRVRTGFDTGLDGGAVLAAFGTGFVDEAACTGAAFLAASTSRRRESMSAAVGSGPVGVASTPAGSEVDA